MGKKETNTWGGKRPGAGRKPVDATPKRSQIAIRVSTAERAKLEALALEKGTTVSAYCRGKILKED